MKYQVQFSERLFVTVAVEAGSEAEALALAQRSWRDEADKIEWVEETTVISVVTAAVPAAVPEPLPVAATPLMLEVSQC